MAIPIAALMQMVGSGMGAMSEYSQLKEEAASMEYEAYIAEQDAQNIERAGNFEQGKLKTSRRKMLARQVALAAASGKDISGGSPLALLESSERAYLLDEQILAWNKHTAVGAKRAESWMLYGMSRVVKKSAKMGLYTSLLGMANKGATSWKGKATKPTTATPKKKGKGRPYSVTTVDPDESDVYQYGKGKPSAASSNMRWSGWRGRKQYGGSKQIE